MKKTVLFLLLTLVLGCSLFGAIPSSGKFDWKSAKSLAPGVRLKTIVLEKPRPLQLQVVRVDLGNPRIYLITSPRDKDWGKPMPDFPSMNIQTRRTRVWDFVKQNRAAGHDVRLGVNAAPWKPWTKPFNHKYGTHIGYAVSEGVEVAIPAERTVPALVVYKNGKTDMIDVKINEKPANVQTAVSGFFFVLRNGKQVCDENMRLEPRTFFGLSRDKRFLYILIADGRQKGFSEGMALCEGARYLKYLGAEDGINMDGGGSTTLVTYAKKELKVVNTPPGTGKIKPANKYRGTRSVANSIGVCLKPVN